MARPRSFDPHEALTALKSVFWEKGYEGASLADLEAATGLNKQSLYRLYPDKRAMYLAALKDYEATEVAAAAELLRQPGTARQRFGRVFDDIVERAKAGDLRGCFYCNASTEEALLDDAARGFLSAAIARLEAAFAETLTHAPHFKNDTARRSRRAATLLAGYFGLRVMVKAGLPIRKIKLAVADILGDI